MKLNDTEMQRAGFLLQGVLGTDSVMVPEIARKYRQLLVFAHGGPGFWRGLEDRSGIDPLDDASVRLARDFMARLGEPDYQVLYPTDHFSLDLLEVGRQLGWQGNSRMSIGIHPEYGTWFAYRVVIAADTDFEVTRLTPEQPCDSCEDKPCITACPVGAVTEQHFDLDVCAGERTRVGSNCSDQCLARLACPVGASHQYEKDQLNYHYARSLVTLKRYRNGPGA